MQGNSESRAEALARVGRFGEALRELGRASGHAEPLGTQVLRAELLEHTGAYDEAVDLARRIVCARQLDNARASRCEVVLGHIAMTAGRTGEALDRYRRAVSLATLAGDLEQLCWAQIRLVYAERTRVDLPGVRALLSDLRANAFRLGNPHVTAALHIFVAGIDGERGLLEDASKHVQTALAVLSGEENCWLRGEAEIRLTVLHYVREELLSALEHANAAIRWADLSGVAFNRAIANLNLGHVLLAMGNHEEAEVVISGALERHVLGGEFRIAFMDGIARAKLAKGDDEGCERILSEMRELIRLADPAALEYPRRWSLPTSIRLHLKRGQLDRAEQEADAVLRIAKESSDRPLGVLVRTLGAEACLLDKPEKAARLLAEAVAHDDCCFPSISANLERAVANVLARDGIGEVAARHIQRSIRILSTATATSNEGNEITTPSVPLECLTNASGDLNDPTLVGRRTCDATSILQIALTSASSLVAFAGRADLLGLETLVLLQASGCAVGAVLLSQKASERPQIIQRCGAGVDYVIEQAACPERGFRISLGSTERGAFELLAASADDLVSISTFQSIRKLVTAAVELEQGRRDRRHRAALWPIEPEEEDADRTLPGVFAGRRGREILALARRVAETTVGVLITGETGTGKELVARVIHRFSARASAPFIPFNCSAVPPDMLDGQLFGHRRGAFTGAVESFPGVIRTSSGGTLLLDEVGEIPLHLQPKLLRFLESGEVHPIGEPRPVKVDVRVMAATNADLQQLVAGKRFREDLFYRLNVVHLCMPPLRERRDEIPLLAGCFLARHCGELGKPDIGLSSDAIEALSLRPWPGNIRELSNEIRRAVALAASGELLTPQHFSLEPRSSLPPEGQGPAGADLPEIAVRLDQPLAAAVEQIERAMVRWAVGRAGGHLERAARSLGLSRKGLYLKRQRLGVEA